MMRLFSRSTYLLLLLIFLGLGPGAESRAETKSLDGIAAVVNSGIITTFQLDQAVQAQLAERKLQKESFLPNELAQIRLETLNNLIDEELLQQRITQLGIKVEDEELEMAIQDVEKKNQLNREELIAALAEQGMDFEDYRNNLKQQILRFKLVGKEVQSKIDVTNQETLEYFRVHIDDYRELPFKRLSRISFPIGDNFSQEQVAEQRKLAEEAREKLVSGANFTTVLLTYSSDRRAEGGDMGTFTPGELTPSFERAIKDLPEGSVSAVIETPRAFHLLIVTEDHPGSIRNYDTVKEEIYQALKEEKTKQSLKDWVLDLRKQAYIDIRN